MKDILLAGIAWSGKGTQARELLKHLDSSNIQYLEIWNVYRALSSNTNIVWDYVKTYTSKGQLLPDAFTKAFIGLVFSSLDPQKRLLIDWFPRMHSQKKMFDEAMKETSRDFIVFHLDISEDIATSRLQNRWICPVCGSTYSTHLHGNITHCPSDNTLLVQRTDDLSLDAIHERFKQYYQETKPILEEYTTEGKVIILDGTKPIEEINTVILEHINK